MKRLTLLLLLCAMWLPAQTPIPLEDVKLPTYIMAGAAYNQYTGGSGFISGIIPEFNRAGVYGSVTMDLVGVKIVDPVTQKAGYGLTPSLRFGQHKVLYNADKSMLTVGGDFGASFSQAAVPSSGVNIGLSGSFTLTVIRHLSPHFAVGVPVRMLWMSGVGPGGTGAWNPVVELGLVWKP